MEAFPYSDDPSPPSSAIEPVWKTGRKRGRSRLRKTLSRHFGYFWFRLGYSVISHLPWIVGRGLSAFLGTLAFHALKRERDVALQSLSRVYGNEKSPKEIRALVSRVFRHSASIIIDWVILRRWSDEKLEARFPEAVASIRGAARDFQGMNGAGVVAVSGHLGNWEILSMLFSRFAPGILTSVAKRLYFNKYNDLIHRLRTEFGLEIIYSEESARKMIRALKSGKALSLLCDQDLRTNSGVFVDFFGLPAYTVTFPVDLARLTRVRMAFCALVREGNSFRIVYRAPYEISTTENAQADVLAATQKWTKILEEEIRKCPEQWSWIHPRWRSTPERPRLQRRKDRED